jgi:hypothetical protein
MSINSAIRMIHADPCTCVREHEQNTPTGEILTLPCVFCDKPHDTLPDLVAHQDECQRMWLGEEVTPDRTVAGFTDRNMRDQVTRALDGFADEYDVADIVSHLQGTFGTVDVDTIPGDVFQEIVLGHGVKVPARVAVLSQPVRTLLNRRKRKASKVNRRKVKGGF